MKNELKTFWTRTYQKRISQMIGICYRYVQDRATAEDLAHDAFLKAIEKADTYKGIGTFDKWLMRITVNTALHYLRDHKTEVFSERLTEEANIPDTNEEAEELSADEMMSAIKKADFTMEEILDAISQLPEHHRIVFNLYVFDRFSHKQIADLQGITVSTSKSHLLRARKELQQILFQKSKHKNRALMTIFPLFIAPEAAVDIFCRKKLDGFVLAPQNPLSLSDFPSAAANRMPFRLWLHTRSAHLAAGAATAGVAAATASILLTSPPQNGTKSLPQPPNPQPITVVADSATAIDETMSEPQHLVPESESTPPKRSPQQTATPNTPEAVTSSDSSSTVSEATRPVVIKKKKHTNRTIVIQNSDKQ